MNQAWKSISGFIVSSTSNFDQLKISFYTEIKKNNKLKKKNHDLMIYVTRHDFYIKKSDQFSSIHFKKSKWNHFSL